MRENLLLGITVEEKKNLLKSSVFYQKKYSTSLLTWANALDSHFQHPKTESMILYTDPIDKAKIPNMHDNGSNWWKFICWVF